MNNNIKSIIWRGCVAIVIFGLGWIVENITGFGFPLIVEGIIVLICGEITKVLNVRHQVKVGKIKVDSTE